MTSERARAGVMAGALTGSATAGALVAFGVRRGGPGEAFAAPGRILLGVAPTEPVGAQLRALGAGLVLHGALALGWGILFALVAARLRGVRLLAAAGAFAALAWAASAAALPALLRLGHGARADAPQLALLHAVLALGLAAGIRLAQHGGRAP